MGASRDFANEYVRLAANRMAALACAFHGSEPSRSTQSKLGMPSQRISSRPRREKVRASA